LSGAFVSTLFYSEEGYAFVNRVCLIDWGCCIDISLFAEGTEFMGDCKTEGFLSTEMIEKKPSNKVTNAKKLLASGSFGF